MDQRSQNTLDYSGLPPLNRPSPSKKPLLIVLGWLLVVGPAMAGVIVGIVVTLSNIMAPGKSYRIGDSVVTPRSQGLAMEWFKLVICILVGMLLSAILYFAVAKARKMRQQP